MSQENKTPRIARDTLITELLGDLGVVHDEIKKPPSKIENVLADSIRLVAKSVNDVESTAEKIKTELNAAYSEKGKQLHALECRLTGQVNIFMDTLKKYGLITHRAASDSQYHPVMLTPNK